MSYDILCKLDSLNHAICCLTDAVNAAESDETGDSCENPTYVEVCNQIDLSALEALLASILAELQAINANTANLEALLGDLITAVQEGNVTLEAILDVLNEINEELADQTALLESLLEALLNLIDVELQQICVDGEPGLLQINYDVSGNTVTQTFWTASGEVTPTEWNFGECPTTTTIDNTCDNPIPIETCPDNPLEVTIVDAVDYEYIYTMVCNTETGLNELHEVTVINGVPSQPVITVTDIACVAEQPPVVTYDFEYVCNEDTGLQDLVSIQTIDGVPQPEVVTATSYSCDTEPPTYAATGDSVCNEDTGFYDLIYIEIIDGVAQPQVIIPTTIVCDPDLLDFESNRICQEGTVHIVTNSISQQGVITEVSNIDTGEECNVTQALDTVCLLAPIPDFTINNGVSADCDVNGGDHQPGDPYTFTWEPSASIDDGEFCFPCATKTANGFQITGTVVEVGEQLGIDWDCDAIAGDINTDGVNTLEGHFLLDGICYPIEAELCSGGNDEITITGHMSPIKLDKLHGPGIKASYTDCDTGLPVDTSGMLPCDDGTKGANTDGLGSDNACDACAPVKEPYNKEVQCVESQEWTYGIDNTGTDTRWDASYLITLSDGSTVVFDQTSQGAAGQWTAQQTEWAANIQAAADNAGLGWFVEPRFILNPNPTDLSGNLSDGTPSGLPGAPSVPVAVALDAGGMRWRYINIQICPGQPVPVSAEILSIDALNGAADVREPGYALTTAGAVLGPVQKFFVCHECGEEPVWYLEDGVTLAESGQIPNCWEPCGTLTLAESPPDRECEFFFAEGCDNNNSDVTDDFTNLVTRRATVCNGEQIALEYFVPDPADPSALVYYVLTGEFVDCATGEPIEVPQPPCDEFVSLGNMYQMGNVSGVLRNREWDIGPGLPGSITTVEGAAIRTSFDESQATSIANTWGSLAVNDTNNDAEVQDVQIIDGYLIVDETIDIRWSGTSLGYFALEVGECCGPLTFQFDGSRADDTASPTMSYTFKPGIHAIKMWNIDERSNTSRSVEYSIDGGSTWTTDATPPGISFSDVKPAEDCVPIIKCVPSGAIVNALTGDAVDVDSLSVCSKMCEPAPSSGSTDALLQELLDCLCGDCPESGGDNTCTVEFKSSGLDTIVTDKGTITITPPNNDGFDTTGADATTWAAAQAEIQAFLDANGGGTATLSYPSQSILRIEVTGTSCTFISADDNSNPGPHNFICSGA